MINLPSVTQAKPVVKEPDWWETLPGQALAGLIQGLGSGAGGAVGTMVAPGLGTAVGSSVGGALAAPFSAKVAAETIPQATQTGGSSAVPLPSVPSGQLKPYQANALAQYMNSRRA